ncbi:SufS family cysteine desulfurase [Thalassotalea sediminis]|uniref:SufS family cysteine desulfurase n=1 Tax=Thalassotalea sediminis TaxID=1759089 RepID=UPI002573621E|nr:SufS family cysteine desulfurase [Thalassotalea sediminis]
MTSEQTTQIRNLFPLLNQKVNGNDCIYFDNAATTQKPIAVIDAIKAYYQTSNANVHRAAHTLASAATTEFENSRKAVQTFINAKHAHEIIWTSGTTEAINLVAQSWGSSQLVAGDEVIVSHAEHHANIVPWQQLEQQLGIQVKVIELLDTGVLDLSSFERLITDRTRLVAVSHISNVIGKCNPIEHIIQRAKQVGAKVLIDAAQSIAHYPLDVQQLDCDFLVFSAHKMYGPTGVGCLFGKSELLELMPPYKTGGEMIKKVSFNSGTTFNVLPHKFETGTPNIAGIISFRAAISFIQAQKEASGYEASLTAYAYQQLLSIPSLNMLTNGQPDIAIFSFNIAGEHQQDVATYLDSKGVAVRVGHHCAMPLMEYLGVQGCIRISLALYNTKAEVDHVVELLRNFLNQGVKKVAKASVNHSKEKIMTLFESAKSWDAKHRQIMLLGKTLPTMADELKTDETLINGCESAAWIHITIDRESKVNIVAFSQAKIIKGLLVIVLAAVNGKTVENVSTFDFHEYFNDLGLLQHLSPSRGNGLLAIVEKIKRAVNKPL